MGVLYITGGAKWTCVCGECGYTSGLYDAGSAAREHLEHFPQDTKHEVEIHEVLRYE